MSVLTTLTTVAVSVSLATIAVAMPKEAMVDLRPVPGVSAHLAEAPTAYDLAGQVVTCDADVPIGILVPDRGVSLTNGVVQGCLYGVEVMSDPDSAGAQRSVISGMTVVGGAAGDVSAQATATAYSVGFQVGGAGVVLTSNLSIGNDYGFYVPGNNNTLRSNRANDNLRRGILVTGDRNLIELNEVLRNQRGGIVIARNTPLFGTTTVILPDIGFGNRVRSNTVRSNNPDVYDLQDYNGSCQDLVNIWTNNVYTTKSRPCLD